MSEKKCDMFVLCRFKNERGCEEVEEKKCELFDYLKKKLVIFTEKIKNNHGKSDSSPYSEKWYTEARENFLNDPLLVTEKEFYKIEEQVIRKMGIQK